MKKASVLQKHVATAVGVGVVKLVLLIYSHYPVSALKYYILSSSAFEVVFSHFACSGGAG